MEKPEKSLKRELPYLPPEIQEEILTWLPGKSLVRLQATCKLWKSWMQDSTFAKKHSDRGSRRYKCIIYFLYFNQGVIHMETIDGSMQTHHKLLIDLQSLPEPVRFNYKISDSCNGIVCIYNRDCGKDIALYNPLTRESMLLAEQSTLTADDNNRSRYQAVHVGFVPSKDEYKIVCIYNDNRFQLFRHCTIFSLSSWSWKKIEISNIKIPISVSPILANGIMFWHSYSNASVLWFDLATEQSGMIDLPPHTSPYAISLSEVEGSLVFLFWRNKDYMSIWKLEDVARGVWMRCTPICNPIFVSVPESKSSDSCLWDDDILDQGRASFAFGNKLYFIDLFSRLSESQVVYYLDSDAKRRMLVRVQPSLHVHSLLSLKKFIPSNCGNC